MVSNEDHGRRGAVDRLAALVGAVTPLDKTILCVRIKLINHTAPDGFLKKALPTCSGRVLRIKGLIFMYAIIETGGKQYRVREGDALFVEKLPVEPGETVTLDRVLAIVSDGDFKVGAPFVEGAKVLLRAVRQGRGKKIIVFKYKPKKNYRRKKGHRQPFTQVVVEKIETGA